MTLHLFPMGWCNVHCKSGCRSIHSQEYFCTNCFFFTFCGQQATAILEATRSKQVFFSLPPFGLCSPFKAQIQFKHQHTNTLTSLHRPSTAVCYPQVTSYVCGPVKENVSFLSTVWKVDASSPCVDRASYWILTTKCSGSIFPGQLRLESQHVDNTS